MNEYPSTVIALLNKYPSLVITQEKFTLSHSDGTGFSWKTENALGNIVAALEKAFPEASNGGRVLWKDRFILGLQTGAPTGKRVLGVNETGEALNRFNAFADGRSFFFPTLEEVEQLRFENNISSAPLRCGADGLSFGKQGNIFRLIYSVLYFYAYFGFGLKKCQLCGKWFAVRKSSAQEKFCSRPFQYIDHEGKTKQYPSCKGAREGIKQRCIMRRSRIYDHLSPYAQTGTDELRSAFRDFYDTCEEWKKEIRKNPSIENLSGYERYLYVDCASLYKKYGRQR